jgi:predicted phosphohydrolase
MIKSSGLGGRPVGSPAGRLRSRLGLGRAGDRLVQRHYPPWVDFNQPGRISDLIEQSQPDVCLFGHFHTEEEREAVIEGERRGTIYDWSPVRCRAINRCASAA